jgi:hypothetical protein
LLQIDRDPLERLYLGAAQSPAIRDLGCPKTTTKLAGSAFLGEAGQRGVEAAKDPIAADAGAEGVGPASRADKEAVLRIVMGGCGHVARVDQ